MQPTVSNIRYKYEQHTKTAHMTVEVVSTGYMWKYARTMKPKSNVIPERFATSRAALEFNRL